MAVNTANMININKFGSTVNNAGGAVSGGQERLESSNGGRRLIMRGGAGSKPRKE